MSKSFGLKIGFFLIILLLISVGTLSYKKIIEISQLTKDMYNHPFRVSKAAITIDKNLISMHRYMKDVVLSKNEEELSQAIVFVNAYEKLVLEEYQTIFEYYLGPIEDVNDSYHTFLGWKSIRERVIKLVRENKKDEAAHITKNEGYEYVLDLNRQVKTLVDFANNKANQFYNKTLIYEYQSKATILMMVIFLVLISVFISVVIIKNMQNYVKKIEELSITDALTGAYNRRYFDKTFQKELLATNRSNQDLVLMLFDIDFFKNYNDHYGHSKGDDALKAVASLVQNNLNRADDQLFRIGGEEFAILLKCTNQTQVHSLCQKIFESIKEANIEHEKSLVAKHLTISMGVGIIPTDMKSTRKQIYKKVDSLMYKSKHDGRNQYKVATLIQA